MDISNAVSTDYEALPTDTPVSKLLGIFDDPTVKGVVVTNDEEYTGVVTRRQFTASHHQPTEKVGRLVWHVPKVTPETDVRAVAQSMLDSDSQLLPVFEGDDMVGVVTVDALLETVVPYLDAVTVEAACSSELLVVTPETTFGEAINTMREHRITHLPVVDGDDPVGVLSLYDMTDLAVREIRQSQGGRPPGFDGHGGRSSGGGYRTHGGFGAREGERDRILDLPVRDIMASPVRTITPAEALDVAVETMFEARTSSLVVVSDRGRPRGILTKTDVLRALTWEAEDNRAVQVYGVDLLDDVNYDEVAAMVEKFGSIDGDMTILDAKIHLHEHDETHRGTPLLLARIRLYTDRGLFIASGEGYGARHALNEARDVLERRIREDKTYGRSKKHPDETFWEKRFGWSLER